MCPRHPRDTATPPLPASATKGSRELREFRELLEFQELRDRELREFREMRDRELQEFQDAAAPASRSPARDVPRTKALFRAVPPGSPSPFLVLNSIETQSLGRGTAPRRTRDVPFSTRIAPKANKHQL